MIKYLDSICVKKLERREAEIVCDYEPSHHTGEEVRHAFQSIPLHKHFYCHKMILLCPWTTGHYSDLCILVGERDSWNQVSAKIDAKN